MTTTISLAAVDLGASSGRVILGRVGPGTLELTATVESHDAASAVLGIPADSPRFVHISCETRALVEVELESPVLTEDIRAANFTNERGIDGTIRYFYSHITAQPPAELTV